MKPAALKWMNVVPWKPGIYLRNNPPSCHVVRQDVFMIEGEPCIYSGDGGTVRLRQWKGASRMWWYGPIPRPPEEKQ